MKYIITFGSGQLDKFFVRPNNVALIIEADSENEARKKAFDFEGIGERFCTSYSYSYMTEFELKYGMKEYTLDDLNSLRRGN